MIELTLGMSARNCLQDLIDLQRSSIKIEVGVPFSGFDPRQYKRREGKPSISMNIFILSLLLSVM